MAAGMGVALFAACDKGDIQVDPGRQGPPPAVVGANPSSDGKATGVALNAPIRVRFDRFLRPDTVVRQSVRITGGSLDPDGGGSIAGDAFLSPVYDVVERVVTFQPSGNWEPSTTYTVTLWSPNDPVRAKDSYGFRALDGTPMAKSLTFHFTTGTDAAPATPATPTMQACAQCLDAADGTKTFVPGAVHFIVQGCGYSGCHAPASMPGSDAPPMGLDLSTIAAIRATAIAKPAHQTMDGPASTGAPTHPPIYGVSMPLIDPQQPGNSYFLYKVLLGDTDSDGVAASEKFWADTGSAVRAPKVPLEDVPGSPRHSNAENARLRGFVQGQHMPVGLGFTISDAKALQDWIAAGAKLEDACGGNPAGGEWTRGDCVPSGAGGAAGAAGASGAAGAGG